MLRKTFRFVKSEEEAKKLCKMIEKDQNSYRNRVHKPYYTPWTSQDDKEHKFVVWYVV